MNTINYILVALLLAIFLGALSLYYNASAEDDCVTKCYRTHGTGPAGDRCAAEC
jgi:hypothetical protein